MKLRTLLIAAAAFPGLTATSHATLLLWQDAVNTGSAPAATLFTPVEGASPILFNVGSLSGDRSFEFIVNATVGVGDGLASAALVGTQVEANGRQGIKFEQWNDTGLLGVTDFGVADHLSASSGTSGADTHLVFTSNGTETMIYIDGVLDFTFPLVGLTITGEQAIGAAVTPTGDFFDQLAGTVLGFASYDTILSPGEIGVHYDAFANPVPEPGSAAVIALAAGAVAARRRRPGA